MIRDTPDADEMTIVLGNHMRAWLNDARVEDLFATCLTCTNVDYHGHCRLAPGRPIPLNVVVNACERYVDTHSPTLYNRASIKTRSTT